MEGYALVHIGAYAPMVESFFWNACMRCVSRQRIVGSGLRADAREQLWRPTPLQRKKHRRVPKRYALVCLEAYAPRLESGTAINAAIMLPRLATCMQSPNLARNHDSEQPWKLYSSKL